MNIPGRDAAGLVLLAGILLATCGGCGTGVDASANLDCPMMLRRVKDGAFEIGRRHPREPRGTIQLSADLKSRIAAYESSIRTCDPAAANTVAGIVEQLDRLVAGRPSGSTLTDAVNALVAAAESLAVEATPAGAYDD